MHSIAMRSSRLQPVHLSNPSLAKVGMAVPRCLRQWAAVALVPLALSSYAGQPAPPAESKTDARGWLQRISKAASTSNYQGTLVFSVGGSATTSRVSRYCVGPHSYEHTESLDGPARLIYRHNQLVHTLWPNKKVAVVEQRDALTPFPALPASSGEAMASYDVKLEGVDRVAEKSARVMLLSPRDEHRFAQRLWAHEDSGLMLRAEVIGPDGQVLESSAFTDIKLGVKPHPETVTQAMAKLEGYRVVRAIISRTKLETEGWRLSVPIDGFRQISCVTRPLDGGEPKPGAATMVQSIYSDGLVHVSVFIEPFDAQRHKPMMSSWGATHAMAQQRDDKWITVMGDVPIESIKKFAAALEKLK